MATQDILLQVLDGRTWQMTLKHGRIIKGWRAFASNNDLNVGDVCIFELTDSQTPCFKVSIIPISQGNLKLFILSNYSVLFV